MPAHLRFTNEQIISSYRETGSVWKGAKRLGMGGQSFWERLKRLGIPLYSSTWTEEELAELRELVGKCTLGDIADRLARPYAGVAAKVSELGIGRRFGNKLPRNKRASRFTKEGLDGCFVELNVWDGSVRQFCVQRGWDLEAFIQAAQRLVPDSWEKYVREHSSLESMECPHCKRDFIPMTRKQRTCSRRCTELRRTDAQYFGGKRAQTVGLSEGICQLCSRSSSKLSSHHVYGKQNDPGNDRLVAVCSACHSLVGCLAAHPAAMNPEFLESLIALAVARMAGERQPVGYHVCVDVEELTAEELGLVAA